MNERAFRADRDQEAEEETPLNEKKKNALLRYMAILFGVAFLLVLLSFLIQMRDSRETISDLSQANTSALQNAEKLQDDNQKLTQEKAALQKELSDLEKQLSAMQEQNAKLEVERHEALIEKDELQKTLTEQSRTGSQLNEAAQLWLIGERERCDRALAKLERAALNESGQALHDQLRTALDADTVETIGETAEGAADTQEEEG